MKTEKVYTQHEENKEWMNSLLFYKDELNIMKERIKEIAAKNSSKDLLAKVEHFQNQLIVQSNNVDTLKHEINLSNDAITEEIKKNEKRADHLKLEDHALIREQMQGFTKAFNEFRQEFNQFLNKTM